MVSRPHRAVLAWLQAVDNANLQLASVSLGEIQAGIEITREQDAAIALVHGLTVVTHNVKDFDGFGVASLAGGKRPHRHGRKKS
jgi:predicted nucleic acid-binding protein